MSTLQQKQQQSGQQQLPPPPSITNTNGALPFNKMFIMIPVMLAARKLNNDDMNTVMMIRIAYCIVQFICLSIVVYTYMIVSSIQNIDRIVYIPAPPQPFADPNSTKKKYTEIKYSTHLASSIRSLLGSTLFGIGLTCVLHYYKGMIMGLAIQTIMGPFNLWENVLIRTILVRGSKVLYEPNSRIFDEKISISELNTSTDEVVDEHGSQIILRNTIGNNNNTNQNQNRNGTTTTTPTTSNITPKSLEDVMLDTWDQGSNANLIELLSLLNVDNINTQTKDDGWTSLMIVSGLKCQNDVSAIRTMITDYKANIMITDNDGWTCLHWAAFHNSLSAATELYHHTPLLHALDNEQKTPLDIAQQENNTAIIDLLQTVMNDTKKDK